jgi:hypothetical protein
LKGSFGIGDDSSPTKSSPMPPITSYVSQQSGQTQPSQSQSKSTSRN